MEEKTPTDEPAGRLVGELSPAGREALARIDAAEPDPMSGTGPDVGGALRLADLGALSAEDRGTIVRILELRARHHKAGGDGHPEAAPPTG